MNNSAISFTKLGTVKSSGFEEMSYRKFFDKMRELILKDFQRYGVKFDDENNKYRIRFNGKSYTVYYGNEKISNECEDKKVLSELDALVSLHQKCISEAKEKAVKENNEKKALERVLENAEEGLLIDPKEQKIYLNYLKKEKKNNTLIKRFLKRFKKDTLDPVDPYGEHYSGIFKACDALCCFIVGCVIFAILAEAGAATLPYIIVGSLFGSQTLYSMVSMILYEGGLAIPFGGPMALIKAFIKTPYQLVRAGLERRKVSKLIKTYSYLVARNSSEETELSDAKQNTKENYASLKGKELEEVMRKYAVKEEDKGVLNNQASRLIESVVSEFEIMRNKVVSITNLSKRNAYSKQLSVVAKEYTERAKTFFQNGVDINYIQDVSHRLASIEGEVDQVLQQQIVEEQTTQEFAAVNEAIDELASSTTKTSSR